MNEKNFTDLARRDTERHLLVAVDESDNSKRAVMYVADFFGSYQDVFITLLSVLTEPSEDYFATEQARQEWLVAKRITLEQTLAGYKEILLGAGFNEQQIDISLTEQQTNSIGETILQAQEKLRCCIVVVGRRGISHSEEFVFGSTSSKILHQAKHCAVMIVE